MARHSLLQSFVPGEGSQRVRTGLTAAQEENSELTPLLGSACAKGAPKAGQGGKGIAQSPSAAQQLWKAKAACGGSPSCTLPQQEKG